MPAPKPPVLRPKIDPGLAPATDIGVGTSVHDQRPLSRSDSYGGGVDEVLGEEPDLELVAAEYVAHEQVVGVVVLVGCRPGDGVPQPW